MHHLGMMLVGGGGPHLGLCPSRRAAAAEPEAAAPAHLATITHRLLGWGVAGLGWHEGLRVDADMQATDSGPGLGNGLNSLLGCAYFWQGIGPSAIGLCSQPESEGIAGSD